MRRPRTVEVHNGTAHVEVIATVVGTIVIATIVHPPVLVIEGGMGLLLARVREGLVVAVIWDELFAIGSDRGSGMGARRRRVLGARRELRAGLIAPILSAAIIDARREVRIWRRGMGAGLKGPILSAAVVGIGRGVRIGRRGHIAPILRAAVVSAGREARTWRRGHIAPILSARVAEVDIRRELSAGRRGLGTWRWLGTGGIAPT